METRADYMGPIKGILLSTDGSEYSEGAIKEALYLARSCGAKLSVIYILEVNPEFETAGQKFVEKMELAAREHLDRIRDNASQENIECEVIVRRTDEPYKAIVEEADKRKSDVIVMGRHGRTGLERVLMGSVTAKVIGYSTGNVLVVPKDAAIDCKKILVATDGSKYSEIAANKAIEIAKRCGSKLLVLSVVPSELLSNLDPDTGYTQKQLELIGKDLYATTENQVKEVKGRAEREGVTTEGLILGGVPYEVILEAAEDRQADLLIVGSHGRTGLKKLIMGSVAERVVALSRCAVLVVKS